MGGKSFTKTVGNIFWNKLYKIFQAENSANPEGVEKVTRITVHCEFQSSHCHFSKLELFKSPSTVSFNCLIIIFWNWNYFKSPSTVSFNRLIIIFRNWNYFKSPFTVSCDRRLIATFGNWTKDFFFIMQLRHGAYLNNYKINLFRCSRDERGRSVVSETDIAKKRWSDGAIFAKYLQKWRQNICTLLCRIFAQTIMHPLHFCCQNGRI